MIDCDIDEVLQIAITVMQMLLAMMPLETLHVNAKMDSMEMAHIGMVWILSDIY